MGVKERTELECSKANAFFLSPLLPSVPVVVTVLAWAGCSGSWATRVATSLPVVGTDAAATTPVVGRMPPGSRAAAVPVAVVTIPVAVAVPLAPAVPVAAVGVAVAVTVVASVRVPVAVSVRRRAVGFASRVAARAAVSHVLSGSGSMSAVGDGEVDTDAASIEFNTIQLLNAAGSILGGRHLDEPKPTGAVRALVVDDGDLGDASKL